MPPSEEPQHGLESLGDDLISAIGSSAGGQAVVNLVATSTTLRAPLQEHASAITEAVADCFDKQEVVTTDVTDSNSQCSFGMYGSFRVRSCEVVLERPSHEKVVLKPFADRGGALNSQLHDIIKNHPQIMAQPLFPMFLIRGSQLKRLQRLPAFEQAHASGLLLECGPISYDKLVWNSEEHMEYMNKDFDESITKRASVPRIPVLGGPSQCFLDPTKKRIFCSHKWLAAQQPSPHPDTTDNAKLKALQRYVADDDYVWLDYCCCPQGPSAHAERAKAIDSLLYYVGSASELLSLAALSPAEVSGDDDGSGGGDGGGGGGGGEAYLSRGWAQLELATAFAPVQLFGDTGGHHQSGRSGRTIGESRYDHSRHASNCALINELTIDAASGKVGTHEIDEAVLRDPMRCDWTYEEDKERVAPLLQKLREMYAAAKWAFPGA